MGLPQLKNVFTVEEYLGLERASNERHEYLDGRIYAMAGESGEHGDITVNLTIIFGNQLKGTPCRARSKDTKVRSGPPPKFGGTTRGLYSYPDIVVICGELEYHDRHKDVVLNPKVIVEVLSKSTESFDRGEKFERLREWNPSLSDYVLVSQDRARIEHHRRKRGGGWTCRTYVELDATLTISSIKCDVALADVYDRVTFSETDSPRSRS